MTKLVVLLVLSAVVGCVQTRPLGRQQGHGKENIVRKAALFMIKFGYLDIKSLEDVAGANDENSPVFKGAIKRLQRFANINVTGNLDVKTLELLGKSRCGLKDPDQAGSGSVGAFKLQGSFWKKKDLTYKITNFTRDGIPREKQRQIFRDAWNLWQSASPLTFTESNSDDADILISYVTKDHGDGYPFDGPGGTLAHAFYPHDNKGLSGDAHFDDEEYYTTGTGNGINLDWVAVHEFGHSLGLAHSNVREAIMYPWYRGYVPDVKLTNDDVLGIQALYGAPTRTTVAPTTTAIQTTTGTPTTTRAPTTTKARATTEAPITTGPPTTTGAPTTTGEPTTALPTTKALPTTMKVPTTTESPVTTELPTATELVPSTTALPPTTTDKPVHPACLPGTRYDAVFVDTNKVTHFLTGEKFWTVSRVGERGEPRYIKDTWSEVDTPVDAAYHSKRGNIVFFKGSRYWVYYNKRRSPRTGWVRRWPYRLRRFRGAVSAVFTFNNDQMTYIFKGTQYWRYNGNYKRRPAHPRKISPDGPGAWPAVMKNLDAATTWINNKVYIFKGESYYRLGSNKVLDRGYPQRIATRWMGCQKATQGSLSIGGLNSEP